MIENTPWPIFEGHTAESIKLAVESILLENTQALEILKQAVHTPQWSDLVLLDALSNKLSCYWSSVSHLHHVRHDTSWDAIYEECLEKISHYSTAFLQDPVLYARINGIDAAALSAPHKHMLAHTLRDFRLSGAALDAPAREKFAEVEAALSVLENTFSQNVLNAIDADFHFCPESTALVGLPEAVIKQAAALAETCQQAGWRFAIDQPTVSAILSYADDRVLRQSIHEKYSMHGAVAPFDNTPIMAAILEKRQKLAKMLGFSEYVTYSLQTRMASNMTVLEEFYAPLIEKAKPIAEKEYAALEEFAATQGAVLPLEPWDIGYYSEKYCQASYGINQESIRHYFQFTHVLSGMFEILYRLFDMTIVSFMEAPVWDPSVRCFEIQKDGGAIGYFYVDPFARPKKRSGAWMDDATTRTISQLPIAYIVMNFRAPVSGTEACLTHDDVVTLFHEMGHGLQHLLTKMTDFSISGIHGVPWDAVEIASQWFENWAWTPEVLRKISLHINTGESLPEDIIKKLIASKYFQSGLQVMRQLEYGLFDVRIHSEENPAIMSILKKVRDQVRVTPVALYDRFPHSFLHIFAGGYAAGYYSYLWAEVLASDAFGAFEECGIFDKKTSLRFLNTFLALGGGCPPADVFRAFRGRDPDPAALLKKLAYA